MQSAEWAPLSLQRPAWRWSVLVPQDFQYKHQSDWRDNARSAYNNTSHTVILYDTQGSARVPIRTLQPGEGGNVPQVVDFVEI